MGRGQGQIPLPPKGRKVLYYRHGYDAQLSEEMEALQGNFVVTDSLDDIQPGDQVLCRFSLLPFAENLEQEIKSRGASLVHGTNAHQYLADMRLWYPDLEDITPKTWFSLEDVEGDGPFFRQRNN